MVFGLEPRFFHWVVPLLVIKGILTAFAASGLGGRPVRQILVAVIGLICCASSLWVETLMKIWYENYDWDAPRPLVQKRYVPHCDFAPWAQCSYVVTSPYFRAIRYFGLASEGSWSDFANPTLGVIFYLFHAFYLLLKFCEFPGLQSIVYSSTVVACIFSLWMAYELILECHTFSLSCVVSWIVNATLMVTIHKMAQQDAAKERMNWDFDIDKYD